MADPFGNGIPIERCNDVTMSAIRVCHIISGDLWAGAEVMAFQLLKGLRAMPEFDPFVIVLNKGRLWEELKRSGIPVWLSEESRRSFPELVRTAAALVKMRSPHIIHSHRYKENIIAWILSLRLRGRVPLVSTLHGMPESHDDKPGLFQRLKVGLNLSLLKRGFEQSVSVSGEIRDILMADHGFAQGRVQVIHNGVEIPEVALEKAKAGRGLVIGSAARFFAVKDLPLMVETAREVAKIQKEIRFELAGEGPMQAELHALIRKYGLENRFVLRGFIDDMAAFYRTLDAYISTSRHEGIPMSVLEAMASGLPVILPRVGGLAEIVTDGQDGFLVEGRDPKDFAARCVLLHDDPGGRQSMAKAAKGKIAREFSVVQMVGGYADLYRTLALA